MHSDGGALPEETSNDQPKLTVIGGGKRVDKDAVRRHYEQMVRELEAEKSKSPLGQNIDSSA